MKRLDEGKASLVEVMRSIKFRHHKSDNPSREVSSRFAHLNPQAPSSRHANPEDAKLVRSGN